nr:MAG TPA: hypothetical protein [Caudoviricetes sp.]
MFYDKNKRRALDYLNHYNVEGPIRENTSLVLNEQGSFLFKK